MGATDTIQVLHVDDDPAFADLAATYLEREDDRFTVRTATSAGEGRELLAAHDIECIISDYDMPGQNGIEFLRTVRADHPNLPFLLFTGKGSEEIASDAISAGVTDYLQKDGGTEQYTVLANRVTNAVESYRSQRALAERNRDLRRYKHMINSMREAACIYDEDGRFVVANEYLAEWYETSCEELQGKRSNLIPTIRDQAGDDDPYQALLDGRREQLAGEVEASFPIHGDAVLAYRLTPLLVDGNVEGVVGVARDVTDRKERERELQRYEAYLEQSTDIITILDDTGTIKYQSPAVERILGYDTDGLLGENGFDFIHPDDREEMYATFADLVSNPGAAATAECRFRTADGEWRWLEVNGTNQLENDSINGIVTNNRDITDRKEREQELQRERDRLDEFASVVSHDLRNPLNVVEGRLELAQEECGSEHLDAIETGVDRMNRIIEDVLLLAREGRDIGSLDTVAVPEAVDAAWNLVAAIETEAELRYTDGADALAPIAADYDRLCQLFENLLRNAMEHGGADVTVTVGALADGFYVEDDGPGIAADERDRVFEAGYSATSDGTGFGLNIVEQVVDAHGWEIHITESADGGARFEITGVEFVDE